MPYEMSSSAFGTALRMVCRTRASVARTACGCAAMYSSTVDTLLLAMVSASPAGPERTGGAI